MPLVVEAVFPERVFSIINGVFTLAVNTSEGVRAEFTCFCFKSWGIRFEVCFAAPC